MDIHHLLQELLAELEHLVSLLWKISGAKLFKVARP